MNFGRKYLNYLEARVGIEPTHKGFADLSLTTWVPRPVTTKPLTAEGPKSSFQDSVASDCALALRRAIRRSLRAHPIPRLRGQAASPSRFARAMRRSLRAHPIPPSTSR